MGSQTRDPITQVLERSCRPILSRGHRLVLSYWRWFGLVVFERDNFLRPGSQLHVMLFCVFGRKPIDRGKSIGIRRCATSDREMTAFRASRKMTIATGSADAF